MVKIKKKIYSILIMVAVVLAIVTGFSGCKNNKTKHYNIVLIVIDTLRSDHLPFYGYIKNTAPFLMEMSKKSIVFKNAFSASSWTSPATASIFTSMYPFQHGVHMGLLAIKNAQKIDPNIIINKIPEEITTITEVLKENGYNTFGVADNLNIDSRQGFTQGFDKFETFQYEEAPNVNKTIKKWKKEILEKGKYFLYIHYMDPHAPYHPREPWYIPFKEKRKHRISAYDSEINFVDQHIKELYDLFKWEKNTLIIITSDHGEGLWDHGYMAHGKTLYREEIQVPLLIYLPGGTKPLNIKQNVSTIDILPTVRDIIGLSKSKFDEGISLVPLIEKYPEKLKERTLFSHLKKKINKTVEWRSTIYKNWHFIKKVDAFEKLFMLLFDKKEENNLIQNKKKIGIMLKKRFEKFVRFCKKFKVENKKIKLDKDQTKKLKTLGYVD